ncbi:MAG: hypothetical protein O7G29_12605, partial [Acidobacteria bacterium]|nr:hypothetical protein [Acidobacteriota bacterium]
HASDVDRAARLRVTEEITAQLETSEADRAALNQRLGESETRRAELARELELSQADRAARLEVILSLQRQIEELATTKAAFKRIAAAVARRLGIYHVLKRQKQRWER